MGLMSGNALADAFIEGWRSSGVANSNNENQEYTV